MPASGRHYPFARYPVVPAAGRQPRSPAAHRSG